MLAVVHAVSKDEGGADANCLSCHKPTIAQQLTEVSEWSTGNMPLFANEAYGLVLGERDTEQLGEWLGQEGDAFCLNEACHNITRQDLVKKTAHYASAIRTWPCTASSAIAAIATRRTARSGDACSQCHEDAPIPDGWLTYDQAQETAQRA